MPSDPPLTPESVPSRSPDERALVDALFRRGQGHVFRFFAELGDAERRSFLDQLRAIDLDLLDRLIAEIAAPGAPARAPRLAPVDAIEPPSARGGAAGDLAAIRAEGEGLLRAGRVAAFVVAGGQGTRLGLDTPKGLFPVGPVTGKSLFQIHAEKILHWSRRFSCPIPLVIMTSPATHGATVEFFERHRRFGLRAEDVLFAPQATIPAVDFQGKLLLEERHRIFTNPNGHGGSFHALAVSGALRVLENRGIEHLSYFQVDNPLLPVLDPVFLGHHVRHRSEMSSKVVEKTEPGEKVGVVASIDGRPGVVEYSDLPADLMTRRDALGRLEFRHGSIAVHAFSLAFVRRMAEGRASLPFHRAEKKIPHVGADGRRVTPAAPNGIKFETFVFDALPFARNPIFVRVERSEEFYPLKNASGENSPETVRLAIVEQHASWLRAAGIDVPRDAAGRSAPLEIGPLFAVDRESLASRLASSPVEFVPGIVLDEPRPRSGG